MKRLLPMLIVTGILIAADQAPDESAKFNGTWLLVRAEQNGITMPKDVLGHSTLTINGNKHTVHLGEDTYEGTHRFNPTQEPKAYDTTITTGTFKGDKQYGIYKLDGEELTICIAGTGYPRPKEFKAPDGSNDTLTIWKRQSK